MRRKYAVVVLEREDEYDYTIWVGIDSIHDSLETAQARGLMLNTSIQNSARKVREELEKVDCFMGPSDYAVQIIKIAKSSMAKLFADDWDRLKSAQIWLKENAMGGIDEC